LFFTGQAIVVGNSRKQVGTLLWDCTTSAQWGVNLIPTLIVFKDGKIVDRLVGAASRIRVQQVLDRLKG
jgi:thiol-disulfide isomerase/thioredoxin